MTASFQNKGVTLIELVITLAIIAVLTMIAFPSYTSYMRASHRTEAKIALMDLASRMERYYAENNNSYTGASITGNLGFSSATTTQGFYTLSIPSLTATSYTLMAAPVAGTSQASDTTCGSFSLTQTGQRNISGSGTAATCWGT